MTRGSGNYLYSVWRVCLYKKCISLPHPDPQDPRGSPSFAQSHSRNPQSDPHYDFNTQSVQTCLQIFVPVLLFLCQVLQTFLIGKRSLCLCPALCICRLLTRPFWFYQFAENGCSQSPGSSEVPWLRLVGGLGRSLCDSGEPRRTCTSVEQPC